MTTAIQLPYTAPLLRLTRMTDDTERLRETPTDVAPGLPADRDTQPPPVIPRAGRVPQLSEPIAEASIDLLLRMYQAAQDRETDLLDADGKLARINDKRADRIKAETVSETVLELSKVVDALAGKPVRELTRKVGELAAVVGKIQTEIEGVKGDVSEMRAELDALRLRVESQQRDLDATIERLDEAEKNWSLNVSRSAEAPPLAEP